MKIKLNLIPPYQREEIAQNEQIKSIVRWEAEITGIIIVFFAMLISLNYVLRLNLMVASSSVGVSNREQYAKIEGYDAEIKDVNALLASDDKIQQGQFYWTKILVKLSNAYVKGVSIDQLATKNYTLYLVGMADNRDNLLKLKSNFENDGCFSSIDLPLSDLVSKENINFQMDLNIKTECLKTK